MRRSSTARYCRVRASAVRPPNRVEARACRCPAQSVSLPCPKLHGRRAHATEPDLSSSEDCCSMCLGAAF
eukprot:1373019-Pleurochrysis_carterae.AAC.1